MENTINASIVLNDKKLFIKFEDTNLTIELPLSEGQYKIILDGINKNFIGYMPEQPTDDELGLLSGLRYMIPMEEMNIVYSAKDRNKRIIMIQVDAVKNVLCVFKLSLENKIESFEIPINKLKAFGKNFDFGQIQILNQGCLVDFGGLKLSSLYLIDTFY